MTDIRDLVAERSYAYLLEWLRWPVMARLSRAESDPDRGRATELGLTAYRQINEILRAALERRDRRTFIELMREWQKTLREDDWEYPESNPVAALSRELDRLILGLAMWAAHLIAQSGDDADLVAMFQAAVSHFGSTGQVAEALKAAEKDDGVWTDWFLSELPTGEAHFIATRPELRRTALLIGIRLNPSSANDLPLPRDELLWGTDELNRQIDSIESRADLWGAALGLHGDKPGAVEPGGVGNAPPIAEPSVRDEMRTRIASLRDLLVEGRELAQADRQREVRDAPIDESKVAELRESVLTAHRKARVFGALLKGLGAAEVADDAQPLPGLRSTHWLGKDMFIHDTNVVGVGMIGNDLARAVRQEELRQMVAALGEGAATPEIAGVEPSALVDEAVGRLTSAGYTPQLILMPLNWRFAREIAAPFGSRVETVPWIPEAHRSEFEGVTSNGLAILDRPGLPDDRFYVVDLAAAVGLREWPSDEESGLRLTIRAFDAQAAQELLVEQPTARREGATEEQAIRDIQERLLVELKLCWEIVGRDPAAVLSVGIPERFRRDEH